MEDTIIDKEHIERRVADWKKRINDLYSTMSNWIENTKYNIRPGSKITMYESLMEQFGIPPTQLDTIDILDRKIYVLSVKPKGLWIIGANGRIDLMSITNQYILVDLAEQFEEPKWIIYYGDKKKRIDFNQQSFLKILNNSL